MIKLYYVKNPRNKDTFDVMQAGTGFTSFEDAKSKATSLKSLPNWKMGIFVISKESKSKLKTKLKERIINNTLFNGLYV